MRTTTRTANHITLGAKLERERLQHKERRLESVVRELHQRAEARRRQAGFVPAPLGHALRDFELELRSLRERLHSSHA
jgi:hypothetical protein